MVSFSSHLDIISFSISVACARQNNNLHKDVHVLIPRPVNVVPYVA